MEMEQQMKEKVFGFIDAHREEMLSLWKELVEIESGSSHKAGVDAVAVRLQKELQDMGAKTQIVAMPEAGNMLIGEFSAAENTQGVLFVGHMDTVFKTGTSVYHTGWKGLRTRRFGYEGRHRHLFICY